MAQIQPNTLISDRYLVVQPVVDDPACDTYLAVDQTAGNAVMIRRIAGLDEAYIAATENRSKLLPATQHPVLPKVFATFRDGRDLFVVFEQIPGETLDAKLAASGKPFPPSWVMFWADQLLDSMNYLHSHNPSIIHGGVSLATIKLSEENHAILSEFGDGIASTDKDERSDIRDLSAALYELLTCEQVPSEASRLGVIANSGADPVKRASDLNPAVTASVAEVIARGISISPNERFNSAGDMQKALRRAFSEGRSANPESGAVATDASAGDPNAATVPHLNVTPTQAEQTGSITMDQTVHMPVPPVVETAASSQADVKTEIISANDATAVLAAATTAGAVASATPEAASAATATVSERGPRPEKKKGSKAGLIVGLFFGFILLGSLLALGGWFAYGYYMLSVGNVAPTPTPTPTEAPTPALVVETSPEASPEPSPEETPEETENTDTDEEPTPRSTPAPATTRTPAQNQPQRPETRATPTTQRTPRPQATPAPRQTPKRDDRTVILQ